MGGTDSGGGRVDAVDMDLTLIIPTRNEKPNVEPLLRRIAGVGFAMSFEVLFVDDSDDGTADHALKLGRKCDFDVRAIHRLPGQRDGGLGGAVVRGLAASRGTYACILDGDLQHPPEVVAEMYAAAVNGHSELVVGSRYVGGGSAAGLTRARRAVSRLAGWAVRVAFPKHCKDVTDPMSGLFLVKTDELDLARVRGSGFKILLEIMATHPHLTRSEVPYRFEDRHAGETKASFMEGLRFLRALAGLRIRPKRRTYYYDIHGLVTVSSTALLPELAPFRVEKSIRLPDITVNVGYKLVTRPGGILYREIFGRFGFAVRIDRGPVQTDISVSRFVALSPHVLYTNTVEPVLRWMFAERGLALVHAACVEHEGAAFFITARTDTGKTTTMLKILDDSEFRFVSDDLTIIDRDGRVLPYPKPLTISAHTLHAVERNNLSPIQRLFLPLQSRLHSKGGRSIGFALARMKFPAATMSALVQMLIPPPKYHIQQLIPNVEIAPEARTEWLFIIERGGVGEVILEHDAAVDILIENCEDAYGFPPYPAVEMYLREEAHGDLQGVERETITAAYLGVPAMLLRSETLDWAERIGALITARPPALEPGVGVDPTAPAVERQAETLHETPRAEPLLEPGAAAD